MALQEENQKALDDMNSEELLFGLPCFVCEHLERCGIGQDRNQLECDCLNDFLKKNLDKTAG